MVSLNRVLTSAMTAVVAVACVLAPSFAQAGSTYQLAFDQATYQVDPGGKVAVSVYLQEQVTGGSTSVLATDGLIGAGMRLSFDVAPLPSDPARIVGLGDVTLNDGPGAFSGGAQSLLLAPGSFVDLTETVDVSSPAVTATDLGGGLFQILIGSFRFTAGSIAGQVTTIRAGDIPGSFQDWITGAGGELDSSIAAGTARIEVRGTAVPEPSGLVGLTVGLLCAGSYGIARRRRSGAGS